MIQIARIAKMPRRDLRITRSQLPGHFVHGQPVGRQVGCRDLDDHLFIGVAKDVHLLGARCRFENVLEILGKPPQDGVIGLSGLRRLGRPFEGHNLGVRLDVQFVELRIGGFGRQMHGRLVDSIPDAGPDRVNLVHIPAKLERDRRDARPRDRADLLDLGDVVQLVLDLVRDERLDPLGIRSGQPRVDHREPRRQQRIFHAGQQRE